MRPGRGSQRPSTTAWCRACVLFELVAAALPLAGCAVTGPGVARPAATAVQPEAIVSGATGRPVGWDEMVGDLAAARVVYVGERHPSAAHHRAQLRVIEALHARDRELAVGMEMFDRSYQPVLDRWSAGELDEAEFLRRTHWYANWRFDFALYRPILDYVKANRLRLVALNLPSDIPRKIRVGGIDYLSDYEKGFLPARVDTANAAHRAFVQQVFRQHDFRSDFEDFYLAQCVWEDVMAESVARSLGTGRMVVLAGNGHIQFKYGIPNRAFERTGAPFRTVFLASQGEEPAAGIADFIWTVE
jgi:uncharacterized iron-regulated protein